MALEFICSNGWRRQSPRKKLLPRPHHHHQHQHPFLLVVLLLLLLGAVLVFLSGWDEIKAAHEALSAHGTFGDASKFELVPLHSALPTASQRRIFGRPPPGVRKVVLATNIAETSITIDDVVFVVDLGRAKEKSYDPVNNLEICAGLVSSRRPTAKGRAGHAAGGVPEALPAVEARRGVPGRQSPSCCAPSSPSASPSKPSTWTPSAAAAPAPAPALAVMVVVVVAAATRKA